MTSNKPSCSTTNMVQLTLKQLKTMYDQPVYVKVLDHEMFADPADDFDGWGMVRRSWVRLWDAQRADLISVKYDFEDYGQTWIAYAYPDAVKKKFKKEKKKYETYSRVIPACGKSGCRN